MVVPVHRPGSKLGQIRDSLHNCLDVELIISLNGEAVGLDLRPGPRERVVRCPHRGRGNALARGAREATGDVVLFLHSDTLLPPGWEDEVRRIIGDRGAVGGAFSLAFDSPELSMTSLAVLSDVWLHLTGHVWGDRAMFVRRDVLDDALDVVDVPIFEDVRLSQHMRRRGPVVLSPLKVVTSGEAFRQNGPLRQLWTIVKCHYWYLIGWSPQRIYEQYYR